MPTFCRHNRFIERCPICSKTLPGNEPAAAPRRARAGAGTRSGERAARRPRSEGLRVRREDRSADDGYGSSLVPGLRASADAVRLAEEIEFANGRLAALAVSPPGLYGEAGRAAAARDLERASWICLLSAYLSPTEGEEPFASIRGVLALAPGPEQLTEALGEALDSAELGPRGSHLPGSGTRTLEAYRQWLRRAAGSGDGQAGAFTGDPGWDGQRRFARLFERLSLPGLGRAGRYELLVTMGRLGLYELRADSLHLSSSPASGGEDLTTLAAKRVFGIGDPLLLERRALALAAAASVPLEALDLALYNWAAPQRATLGFRTPEGVARQAPGPDVRDVLGV